MDLSDRTCSKARSAAFFQIVKAASGRGRQHYPRGVFADEVLRRSLRVLLVEGDVRSARTTAQYLEAQGLTVFMALMGEVVLAEVQRLRPDIVLLEAVLPDKGGYDVCSELRDRFDTPIIMVTTRGDEADRLRGFESGADDYVTKPFSSRELLARICTHASRARGRIGRRHDKIAVGDLQLDLCMRMAHFRQKWLPLTVLEFNLLRILAERAGQPISRDLLRELTNRPSEASFERSIDVHISRLRRKLETDSRHPVLLKTVRGIGYMIAR